MNRLAPLARPVHWYLRRKERAPGRSPGRLSLFSLPAAVPAAGVDHPGHAPDAPAAHHLLHPRLRTPGGSPWPSGDPGRFLAAAAAFIINYACYFSVIYRGGIQGVPVGQQEAGLVLGMTRRQIFFKVTLLQMVKRIVPPMSNEIITLVKDTSIARIISFQEVIWAGYAFLKGSHGYSGLLWPLFFTGVYYLIFNGLLTILFAGVEKKLSYFQ